MEESSGSEGSCSGVSRGWRPCGLLCPVRPDPTPHPYFPPLLHLQPHNLHLLIRTTFQILCPGQIIKIWTTVLTMLVCDRPISEAKSLNLIPLPLQPPPTAIRFLARRLETTLTIWKILDQIVCSSGQGESNLRIQ